MAEIVYRSAHLVVKIANRGGDVCVVTFDAFTDTTDLDRPAFAERFFQDHQVSAVHIINGCNRWYHEPDWRAAISTARRSARAYPRIVTYGSSMGGYAALLFSSHLGAQTVLALSPQYSRDPHKVPFESRWGSHRRERWLAELSGPLPPDVRAIIAYDPMVSADRAHVDLIANEMAVSRLTFPHAGHGSAAFLAEVGLLGPLVLSVVSGSCDLANIVKGARERRKRSPHYLIALSEGALARGRPDLAKRLADRATIIAPTEEGPWHALGSILDRLGESDEALAAHRRAAMIAPHVPAIQFGLAVAQRRAGDLEGALKTLGALTRQPVPVRSARAVARAIWSTRILRCLALVGVLPLLAKVRLKGKRGSGRRPLPRRGPMHMRRPPLDPPACVSGHEQSSHSANELSNEGGAIGPTRVDPSSTRWWRRLGAVFAAAVLIGAMSAAYSEWLGYDAAQSYPPTGSFAAVDGHTLHYREQRPAGALLGTIVLIHGGWAGHADLFSTLAPQLSGYRVIAVDRPGQGWSERQAGSAFASPERQAATLMTLLDRIAPEKLVLVAHSLAGALSTHLALTRPERLHGLVLIDALTHPFLGDPPAFMSLLTSDQLGPIINRVVAIPLARILLGNGVALAFAPQAVPPGYAGVSGLPLMFRESAFRSNLQDIVAADAFLRNQAPRYRELQLRVVVITGEQDGLVSPLRNAVRFAREAPQATLAVLQGIGHMPHHAAPAVIADATKGLLPHP